MKHVPTGTAHHRGRRAEQIALDFLVGQGLTELSRNYRTRFGEIDLVMLHAGVVVFIEVRARSASGFMMPVETIDPKKVRKIILASRLYMQNQSSQAEQYRFDIVSLTGDIGAPEIDWIQNAFADEQPA